MTKNKALIHKIVSDKFKENGVTVAKSGINQIDKYFGAVLNRVITQISEKKLMLKTDGSVKEGNIIKFGIDAVMLDTKYRKNNNKDKEKE